MVSYFWLNVPSYSLNFDVSLIFGHGHHETTPLKSRECPIRCEPSVLEESSSIPAVLIWLWLFRVTLPTSPLALLSILIWHHASRARSSSFRHISLIIGF